MFENPSWSLSFAATFRSSLSTIILKNSMSQSHLDDRWVGGPRRTTYFKFIEQIDQPLTDLNILMVATPVHQRFSKIIFDILEFFLVYGRTFWSITWQWVEMTHVVARIDTTATTAVTQCIWSVAHFKCFSNTRGSRLDCIDVSCYDTNNLACLSLIWQSILEPPI